MAPVTENAVDEHAAPAADKGAEPPVKKAKVDGDAGWPDHTMNVANAVMDEYAGESFKALAEKPVRALKGIGEKSESVVSALGVKSIADLGKYKFYLMARAISALASTETAEGRPSNSRLNADMAVDSEFEAKSLTEIANAPVSALQGISEESSNLLTELGVKTVRDLASWKFATWAESITTLAAYEHEKSAGERKQEAALKKLE